jgi:hypothetical protein
MKQPWFLSPPGTCVLLHIGNPGQMQDVMKKVDELLNALMST